MKTSLMKKDGYVLIWVLCIFFVVAILATAFVSLLFLTSKSTVIQHDSQQAYLTAKSAASSVADYIIENSSNSDAINNLINHSGSGSTSSMGNYTVSVSYVSSSKIKVLATATYNGETRKVAAYLVMPPAPSGIIPTDNAIFVNGSATSGFGQCSVNGSVYVDGAFNLSQGSAINGMVVAKGATSITGAGNTTKGLVSFGNVTLDNSGTVNGDVLTSGDVKMYGNSLVTGSLYSDNSLDMSNGSSVISNNAFVGKNVSFGGGSNRIRGALSYGNTVTCAYGGITTFVPKGATKTSNYTALDLSSYNSQALPIITAPTQAQNSQLYNTVVISNNTISNSGTITSTVASQINSMSYGATLKIDASTKDISLLLNNVNLNLGSGLNIEIKGTNNVFIYLKGTASLSISSNEYIGNEVRGTNPHLYIIGDGAQSINLSNNSELDAVVYIPNGSLTASGSPLTTYKFIGCCIVKTVNISSNVAFQYSEPEINNTPLAIFQNGSSGSGNGAWMIESWADN